MNANARTYVKTYATLEKAQKDYKELSKAKDKEGKKDDKKKKE